MLIIDQIILRCPKMKPIVLVIALFAAAATPVLAQNATQINQARGGANCAGCNLFQADFANLSLTGKNFAGARLRQADLSLGTFNRTNFSGTDLRDVNAFGGLFSSASFARANLTNASFVGTYLEGANFSGANLSGANFSGAEMGSARGITQAQMDQACGDRSTIAPKGIRIPVCQ